MLRRQHPNLSKEGWIYSPSHWQQWIKILNLAVQKRHCDVGSSYPGGGEAPKGLAVRQLKRYASWVQTVVRQVGLLSTAGVDSWEDLLLVNFATSRRDMRWKCGYNGETFIWLWFKYCVHFRSLCTIICLRTVILFKAIPWEVNLKLIQMI